MGTRSSAIVQRWRDSRPLRATAGTAVGFAATVIFALYNGALGVLHASLWHGSISAYYILLSLLRGRLLLAGRTINKKEPEEAARYERRLFFFTSAVMLIMNLALTVPVSLMALDRRGVQAGMIPAIASAAYTTYKISAAAVKLRGKQGGLFDRELRFLRFVDALVSVLVLQNTLLIAVDGGVSQRMLPLVAISSAGILLVIFAMTLAWLVRGRATPRNVSKP